MEKFPSSNSPLGANHHRFPGAEGIGRVADGRGAVVVGLAGG
jgi:hypothetical protein